MPVFFWWYLAAVNLAALFACLADKRAAVKGRWRISERALLTLCALGGGPGFYLGMHWFHHKTRPRKFTWGVPALCLLWLAGMAAWLWLGRA